MKHDFILHRYILEMCEAVESPQGFCSFNFWHFCFCTWLVFHWLIFTSFLEFSEYLGEDLLNQLCIVVWSIHHLLCWECIFGVHVLFCINLFQNVYLFWITIFTLSLEIPKYNLYVSCPKIFYFKILWKKCSKV